MKNEKKLNQIEGGEGIVNKKDFHPNSIGSRIDLESLKKIMEIKRARGDVIKQGDTPEEFMDWWIYGKKRQVVDCNNAWW